MDKTKDSINNEETEDRIGERKVKRSNVNRKRKRIVTALVLLISIVVWGSIVYYGVNKAKAYVDTINVNIINIQQQNAFNIKQVDEQMQLLKTEIEGLRTSIDDTGDSLSSSGNIQSSINKRLKQLDERLEELEASLDLLQEAP